MISPIILEIVTFHKKPLKTQFIPIIQKKFVTIDTIYAMTYTQDYR